LFVPAERLIRAELAASLSSSKKEKIVGLIGKAIQLWFRHQP
jgi:hypothetical protein